MRAIGTRIRSVRGALTQQAFAELLGIKRFTVANYEAGRHLPNEAIIARMAELGRTTPTWLLTGQVGDRVHLTRGSLTRERDAALTAAHVRSLDGGPLLGRVGLSDDELTIVEILRFADAREVIRLAQRAIDENLARDPRWREHFKRRFARQIRRIARMAKTGCFERGEDWGQLRQWLDHVVEFESGVEASRRKRP